MRSDELKNSCNRARNQQVSNLTHQQINEMIQKRYSAKMSKIAYSEFIGSVICLMTATFIGFNFYKLDTIFLKSMGTVAILTLLALSILSLLSLKSFTNISDMNKPYVETLKVFAINKLRFYTLQKLNVTLSYLLMVTTVILIAKFFNGIDVTSSKYFWLFSFTFGYVFLQFYAKWVMKFYKNTISQTEELLDDLST